MCVRACVRVCTYTSKMPTTFFLFHDFYKKVCSKFSVITCPGAFKAGRARTFGCPLSGARSRSLMDIV